MQAALLATPVPLLENIKTSQSSKADLVSIHRVGSRCWEGPPFAALTGAVVPELASGTSGPARARFASSYPVGTAQQVLRGTRL